MIKDFLGNEWDIDCLGCAISNQTMSVPGGLIQRTQYFCVHQDPLVPLPGFLVIASLRHIQSLSEMDEREYNEFSNLVKETHQAIKEVIGVKYLTVIQEEKAKHFHLWFFPWSERLIVHYGQPALTKIREIMADFQRPLSNKDWKELERSIKEIRNYMSVVAP